MDLRFLRLRRRLLKQQPNKTVFNRFIKNEYPLSFWQFITREALIWGLLSKPHIYGIAPQAIFRSLYRCCYGESSSGIGSDASFVKTVKNRFSRPFSKRPAAQPQKRKSIHFLPPMAAIHISG